MGGTRFRTRFLGAPVSWEQRTSDAEINVRSQLYMRYQIAAESAARAEQVAFVPLIARLVGRPELFVDGVHMNAEGYGRVAEAIGAFIVQAPTTR